MDFKEIKEILEMMREHDLAEFELERDNVKLRLRKNSSGHWNAAPSMPHASYAPPVAPAATAVGGAATLPVLAASEDETVDFAVVKSPIVGTFYRAPEPGANPFAEVGATVRKGQVLCIIEAMKLMNEIEADHSGTIVEVFAQNGKAVEFGQKLFRIKKA